MDKMREEINQMKRKISELMLDLIMILNAKLFKLKTIALDDGKIGNIKTDDSRFTFISNKDIKSKLNTDYSPSRIIKSSEYFRINKTSEADNEKLSIFI